MTQKIKDLAILDAARVGARIFSDFCSEKNEDLQQQVHEFIADFHQLYERRPLQVNDHGSGFDNLLWLYVTGRLLRPDLMVESGVWRGQSS